MKRMTAWITAILVLLVGGAWACKELTRKPGPVEKSAPAKADSKSYWTCPMHPQIHQGHPGECPICHMKLVQVKEQQVQGTNQNQKADSRRPVVAGVDQLALAGIQKHEVERMNLRLQIPVSGRFVSTHVVAFQVYESDLRYVKSGLLFKGESSFSPEDDLEGVISSVDSIVDPTSRTVRVLGAIRKGPRDVPSETGFRGDIEIELKNRIAIPESAVLHTGSGDIVYLFSGGDKLVPQRVKLGQKATGFFDVISGLQPGQSISTGPNFLLDSEAKIRGAQ